MKINATDSQIFYSLICAFVAINYKKMNSIFDDKKYPLQNESYEIIRICMEVHRILGKGFLEIVYKDALEYEFNQIGFNCKFWRRFTQNK